METCVSFAVNEMTFALVWLECLSVVLLSAEDANLQCGGPSYGNLPAKSIANRKIGIIIHGKTNIGPVVDAVEL